MKYLIHTLVAGFVLASAILFFVTDKNDAREEYELFLQTHPYLQRNLKEVNATVKQDRPDLAWELNYLLTMDPATRQTHPERLIPTFERSKISRESLMAVPGQEEAPWIERGPNNVGGRSRALAYDPNQSNKVWAGSVSGGLWFNNDITDENSSWHAVDDFWANLAVTCIAFDPNNANTLYIGTGEGWGNLDAVRGAGIWKSTDGGDTWNQLAASGDFYFVHDLVVRDESDGVDQGVLYVASSRSHSSGNFHGVNAVYSSSDGGTTFSENTSLAPTDLAISADGRLWAGTSDGKIAFSDDGTNWTESYSSSLDRVAIACAPSNNNVVYGLIADGSVVGQILFTSNNGENWTTVNEPADADQGIPDDDFSRGQAWYDLVIAADPNDENTVIVGAIDLFRSTDNGTNWNQISKWSNNNDLFNLNVSLVHADQHAITFKGTGSSEVLFGNDGGIYYSPDLSNAGSEPTIDSREVNYNTTQFYACAIHPTEATDHFLAGSQDNGSHRFNSEGINSTAEVSGGDGAFCFIDQTNPEFQITSYVYNVYFLSSNGGTSFHTDLNNDQETGLFINPADYDDVQDILFSTNSAVLINRIAGVTSSPQIETIEVDLGSESSHLRVSPHTTGSSTLFVGTLSGRVFRIENADTNPTSTEITGSLFPTGSVSCIEIGADEDELLVTFSNYGVSSVWYSNDGGSSWSEKEGNLPDMPVRWALFNPNNRNEVILATEMGVWRTVNLVATSPQWISSNSGLANVRVDMLQIRDSDYEVIAASHGRGLFSSSGFRAEGAPLVDFTADRTQGCSATLEVNFTNLSSAVPEATNYSWSFPGGSPSSSTEQNPPTITYTEAGVYDVSLSVANSIGTTTETKTNLINLGEGFTVPFEESFEVDSESLECWNVGRGQNDLGQEFDWEINTITSASGERSYRSQFEAIGGTNSEDWLFSPQLNLSKSLKNTLSFFSREAYDGNFGSQYHVRATTSSNPSDLGSYSNLVTYTESDFSFNFEEFSIDLSALDGQKVHIAFVHEQDDGDDWFLDDVSVSGTPITISVDGETTTCPGEAVTLSTASDDDFDYQWKNTNGNIDGAITSSFQPTESGTYSVAVTYGQATVETDGIDIVIASSPVFNSISANQSLCEGDNATISISVSGDNLTYQWQKDGLDITDDNHFTGTNTSDLVISNARDEDAATYGCVIGQGACEFNFDESLITVSLFPVISGISDNQSICIGETVNFSITADDSSLDFQWQKDGSDLNDDSRINGATSNDLMISDLQLADAGEYSCIVSRNGCEVESDNTNLIVISGHSITDQPDNTSVQLGQTISLSVMSSDENVTYSWFFDDALLVDAGRISGSATANLTISEAQLSDTGDYSCEVDGECVSITSDIAEVIVEEVTNANAIKTALDIYPNPSHGEVTISLPDDMAAHFDLHVYDFTGKKVIYKRVSPSGQNRVKLNLDELSSGSYYLQFNFENLQITRQVNIR